MQFLKDTSQFNSVYILADIYCFDVILNQNRLFKSNTVFKSLLIVYTGRPYLSSTSLHRNGQDLTILTNNTIHPRSLVQSYLASLYIKSDNTFWTYILHV